MADNDNKTGAVVMAFILGGIVGAALGIVFAPTSGKETRKRINGWMDDALEKSKDTFEKVQEELKHRKDQFVQAVTKHTTNA